MGNRWVNPPPRPKVEGEFNFDNPTPIDYSPSDVWDKVSKQVGKKKIKKKKELNRTHR
jgi:hypothetical protein